MRRVFKCPSCHKELNEEELHLLPGKLLHWKDGGSYDTGQNYCEKCFKDQLISSTELVDANQAIKDAPSFRQAAEQFQKIFTNNEKGEFAEKLVKFLLESTGWYVVPFGYEKNFNMLAKKIDFFKIMDNSLNRVRFMPDFFCMNQNTSTKNITYFVEVKYRTDSNGQFEMKKLEYYKKFWPETIIVVVRKTFPYILFQQVSQLQIKEKYAVEDFQTDGLNWFYRLSRWTITKLLNDFHKQSFEDKSIVEQLSMFEKVEGKYFYSYKEQRYYAYVDEKGVETIVKPGEKGE